MNALVRLPSGTAVDRHCVGAVAADRDRKARVHLPAAARPQTAQRYLGRSTELHVADDRARTMHRKRSPIRPPHPGHIRVSIFKVSLASVMHEATVRLAPGRECRSGLLRAYAVDHNALASRACYRGADKRNQRQRHDRCNRGESSTCASRAASTPLAVHVFVSPRFLLPYPEQHTAALTAVVRGS